MCPNGRKPAVTVGITVRPCPELHETRYFLAPFLVNFRDFAVPGCGVVVPAVVWCGTGCGVVPAVVV